MAGADSTSSRSPRRTRATTCRIRKSGSRASIGHELVQVLHWMHEAIAPPPGVEATSLQKEGLSGTTRAGTGTAAYLPTLIRVLSIWTGATYYTCIRSRKRSGLSKNLQVYSSYYVAASRLVSERVPRLAYGDRMLEGFLPERVLSEGRLIPLQAPQGAPGLPDVAGAPVGGVGVGGGPHRRPPGAVRGG